MRSKLCLAVLILLAACLANAQDETPYEQEQDHVYATIDGQDFYMDIFTPKEVDEDDPGAGLGIVDIASGAWYSSRDKIEDHKEAQMYDIYAKHGYTVFAVRPGTRPAYPVLEMVDHIERAIRYIKANAEKYNIDPDKLGITGASAGGHLALLTALSPEEGDPDAEDPLLRHSTNVAAAGIFFPPTDFLDWGGSTNVHERLGELYFKRGVEGKTPEEIEARAKAISPRHQVTGKTVPILLYHGDADPLVPLQQSEVLVEELKKHGNQVELHVVAGGAHPWPTINEEVAEMADWFDRVLAGEGA